MINPGKTHFISEFLQTIKQKCKQIFGVALCLCLVLRSINSVLYFDHILIM